MSWHGNWSASSGKGGRRDNWNSSGNGKWTHYGDSQPSWGKGHGKSWNNSWDRGNQLPGPPQPSWIATMAASTVESAVTSWVQSFFNRVANGPGTSSPPPAVASEPHPGPAAASPVARESDGEMRDDVICVAQRLIMAVRKATAAEGRPAPAPKSGKKNAVRRSRSKMSSSDSSGDEVLHKRRRSRNAARPVTLPLTCAVSPSPHGHTGDIVHPGTSRARASSGSTTEAAWVQVRELRALVKEQQNIIRQMQMAPVDGAPPDGHREAARDLVDTPCHAAFMIFLGCEACAELKENMPVNTYMTFMAKKQCREWWVRKSEALLDDADVGEETPCREMVSQLWRKFHDVVGS